MNEYFDELVSDDLQDDMIEMSKKLQAARDDVESAEFAYRDDPCDWSRARLVRALSKLNDLLESQDEHEDGFS